MKPLESYVSDLESPVEIIRVQTVVELVRSGDIRTVPHLKRVADNDESPQVRYLAKLVGRDDGSREELIVAGREESGDIMKTMAGSVVVTPVYMPPEQAAGQVEEMDQRSDIYALGALLYELLTLQPPFSGDNPWDILQQVCSESPVVPSVRAPERAVPPELEAVVMTCMARHKHDRYQSIRDLKEDIKLYLSGRLRLAKCQIGISQ